jgi:hypothetical protein
LSSTFWALALAGEFEFFASAGVVAAARAAIEPAKINPAIRMRGSPSLKRIHFEQKRFWRFLAATISAQTYI